MNASQMNAQIHINSRSTITNSRTKVLAGVLFHWLIGASVCYLLLFSLFLPSVSVICIYNYIAVEFIELTYYCAVRITTLCRAIVRFTLSIFLSFSLSFYFYVVFFSLYIRCIFFFPSIILFWSFAV